MTELVAALDATLGRQRPAPTTRGAPISTSHGARVAGLPTLNVHPSARRGWLPAGGVLLVAASAAAAYALVSGGRGAPGPAPIPAFAPAASVTAQPGDGGAPAPRPPPPPTPPPIPASVAPAMPTTPMSAPPPSRSQVPSLPAVLVAPTPPAAVPVALPPPPVAAAVASPPPAVAPPGLPVMTKPEVIRRAVAGLGYKHLGVEPNEATPSALVVAIAVIRQGVMERSERKCADATKTLSGGAELLEHVERTPTAVRYKVVAHLNIGMCALGAENYASARVHFGQAIPLIDDSDPASREALLAQAITLWQLDDPTGARAALKRALTGAAPTDAVVWAYSQVEGPLGLTRQ